MDAKKFDLHRPARLIARNGQLDADCNKDMQLANFDGDFGDMSGIDDPELEQQSITAFLHPASPKFSCSEQCCRLPLKLRRRNIKGNWTAKQKETGRSDERSSETGFQNAADDSSAI